MTNRTTADTLCVFQMPTGMPVLNTAPAVAS